MPTIIPKPGQAPELAVRLLKAAGDHPERVRTSTHGGSTVFDVDDDLAATIAEPEPEPEQPAEKPATKPSTRKPKANTSSDT
ncbi:hypothetical protein ACLQ3K_22145 [Tsukamurella sp. DT100]|uniref:hypothetical protein n=1 Tax=Tsukamurella sp. DT100 TaxID=3393415 RepID=UPI003CEA6437